MDDFVNAQGKRVGIILTTPNKMLLEQSLHFDFRATNNDNIYEAFIIKLKLAQKFWGRKNINI